MIANKFKPIFEIISPKVWAVLTTEWTTQANAQDKTPKQRGTVPLDNVQEKGHSCHGPSVGLLLGLQLGCENLLSESCLGGVHRTLVHVPQLRLLCRDSSNEKHLLNAMDLVEPHVSR